MRAGKDSLREQKQLVIREACSIIFLSISPLLTIVTGFSSTPQTLSRNGAEGVVVDLHGAPIPDAAVSIHYQSLILKTATNQEGRFFFDLVSPVNILLSVDAKGFAHFEQRFDLATQDFANLRLVLSPAPVLEQVTITATRTETRISDTAADMALLNSEDLRTTAAMTVDDKLRQIPGFSLFRRSGSRMANPTTQGVSLRGAGASAASRAIVLGDGLPLNDPFGGWVYWDRVPLESIKQVEVLRGGASHLYGSGAIGGLINIMGRRSLTNALSMQASYGNEATPNASVFVSTKMRHLGVSLAGESFNTDGYVLVAPNERGAADTSAGSRHGVVTINIERRLRANKRIFGGASFFGESRKNGTALQTNRTHLRQFFLGGEFVSNQAGTLSARAFGGTQVYDQNFSAVSADRNSEILTRVQRIPAQSMGFSSQWSRTVGRGQTMVAGFESLQVRGVSNELALINGQASSLISAGGRQQTFGGYFEDLVSLGSRLVISAGGRIDHWRNYNGLSATRPLAVTSPTTVSVFQDRAEMAVSPQLSAVYKINSHLSLLSVVSRAFRGPTLNELYRSFRVGSVLTMANEQLRAEILSSGEVGGRFTTLNDKLLVRGTAFWSDITHPITNVTLRSTPVLITRQRQNLGRSRSRGVEIDVELAWGVT